MLILCPIMLPSFGQFTLCNTIFSVFSNPIIILRLYVTTIDLKWKIQDENEFDSVTSTKIINKALWNYIHFCTQMHIFRGLYVIGDWVRSCSTERCALFIHCLFVLFFQQLREFFPLPKEKHLHLEAVSVSSRPYLGCINKSNSQNNKLANQEYGRLWPKTHEMAQTYMKGIGGNCRKLSMIKGNLHSMQQSGEQLSNLQ